MSDFIAVDEIRTPAEPAILTNVREERAQRLMMAYAITGLFFMLLPGTFLGVWNLISISRLQATEKISPGWIQAHGHAQIFGWAATFILGIGFYSIPKLRKMKPFPLWRAWVCWSVWTGGVLLRWAMTMWPWHWRGVFPLSAALELGAFLLFFLAIGPAAGIHPSFAVFVRLA